MAPAQGQVTAVKLWAHELKDGEIIPPPAPNGMGGQWLPQQMSPGPTFVVILWAWVPEPGQIAVPGMGLPGGFVGAGQ